MSSYNINITKACYIIHFNPVLKLLLMLHASRVGSQVQFYSLKYYWKMKLLLDHAQQAWNEELKQEEPT